VFRGPATLLRASPYLIPLVIGGSAATLLLLPIGIVLHSFFGEAGYVAMPFIAFGFGVTYLLVLHKMLVPRRDPVNLYVDHGGIYANDAPLMSRADIREAYIRPNIGPQRGRVSGSAGVFFVRIPPFPLTVEVLARGRRQVNIDPGDQRSAAAILVALGFPVMMCPPDYRMKPSRTRKVVSVVVVLVLLFVVLPIVARIVVPLVFER
jgi:hypothetical protein